MSVDSTDRGERAPHTEHPAVGYLPWLDLRGYQGRMLGRDLTAAAAVAVLTVPQAVAYALIAGVPPVMGLYAAAIPVVVGSLFRSSRHVITGPSNAMSLLVGSILAGSLGGTPAQTALILALTTGAMQLAAGLLRLGALVDYISGPVVLGYVTGAGILIGLGQLGNATGVIQHGPGVVASLTSWASGLDGVSLPAMLISGGTVVTIVVLRRIDRRIPGAVIAMALAIVLSWALGLSEQGVQTIADVGAVPRGLPPFATVDVSPWLAADRLRELLLAATACMVLSLVESSAVARSLAAQSGQRVDMSVEFAGQGLANIAAGLFGGFVTSGSLGRSALSMHSGARTRLAGVLAGTMMMGVLMLLGPVVNYTPVASLAGVLLVIASDLVDIARIRTTMRATKSDATAFIVTVLSTWLVPLHYAIEIGVAISIALFLRRARLLTTVELTRQSDGRFVEVSYDQPSRCGVIRILQVEGTLFFGAAGELQRAMDELIETPHLKVLVVRLKRTQDLDATTSAVLEATAARMANRGQHLILAGMRERAMELIERTELSAALGEDHLFPTRPRWFAAMEQAVARAHELAGDHHGGQACPMSPPVSGED